MEFQLQLDIKRPASQLAYGQKILLTGSCFSEHIGNALADYKFEVLQNPNGILFDPVSVCESLISYAANRQYTEADLFELNEVRNSWNHHSRFSHISSESCLEQINLSQQTAHRFLREADWVIITLGSSFSYRLSGAAQNAYTAEKSKGAGVANCHRAPAAWFNKYLLETEEILSQLDNMYHRLRLFNPKLKFIFTISPVRHIRDGVIENNRSKARLIEAVHHTVNKFEGLWYFPAYELVVDILRDYRFYDVDMVHPNYAATGFVMEKFTDNYIEPSSRRIMEEVLKIVTARKHKALQPDTTAHQRFLETHARMAGELMKRYPFLSLEEEIAYFSSAVRTR